MGWFDRGFLGWARPGAGARGSRAGGGQAAQSSLMAGTAAPRKELLRNALQDMLADVGIPPGWLGADLLRSTPKERGEAGIHVRLLVRHWDERLLVHGVALEQEFLRRVLQADPTATGWLMGISWQYAMHNLAACPPLPPRGSWAQRKRPAAAPAVKPPAVVPAGVEMEEVDAESLPGLGLQQDVKADLERLLALRDEDLRRHRDERESFAVTQPMAIEGLQQAPRP